MDQNFRLTKDDVKAIRQASSFSVECNRAEEGGTVLHVWRKEKKNAIWTESNFDGELRRSIKTEAYNEYGTVAYFGTNYPDGAWQAFRTMVRPGDRLCFRAFDNANGYLRGAVIPIGALGSADAAYHPEYKGLHLDVLQVSVFRTDKSGRERCVINDLTLHYVVTPDNTARAIKSKAPNQYSLNA